MIDSDGRITARIWSPGRVAALVAIICLVLDIRALYCDFCPSDDYLYVIDNTAIRSLDGQLLSWAFTTTHAGWWMPLVWLSLAVDYHFWQLNPFGYHLTNILLHSVNAVLVVLVADRLLAWPAAGSAKLRTGSLLYPATLLLAGLLFAIHPLRVEAVVWVTSRKDLLNGLFFLGAILFYLRHVRHEPSAWYGSRDYLLALCCFLLSLMAKPVSVVLPLLLLVLDWYPLGRFRQGEAGRIIREKAPFLLLATAAAAATLAAAAAHGMLQSTAILTPGQRFIVSGYAIAEYVRLLLVPVGIIPLQQMEFPLPPSYGVKAAGALVLCIAAIAARKWQWLTAAWLWFILLLLPVLAFFQNGDQAYAARYTYLPSVAPGIVAAVICGSVYAALTTRTFRVLFVVLVALYVSFLGGMNYYLAGVWDSGETYWSRVIALQPLAKPYFKRAEYYAKNGRYAEAVKDYTALLERASGEYLRYRYNIYAFRGEAYRSLGRYAEAVDDLTTAIELSPRRVYYQARGQALQALGRRAEAAADFRLAGDEQGRIEYWYQEPSLEELSVRLERDPADADALLLRASMHAEVGNYAAALADLEELLRSHPASFAGYANRGLIHFRQGRIRAAIADYDTALRLNNKSAQTYYNRGLAFAAAGEQVRANADFQQARRLGYDVAPANGRSGAESGRDQ